MAQWKSVAFTLRRSKVRSLPRPQMKNKIIFWLIWLAIVLLGPVAIIRSSNLLLMQQNRQALAYFFFGFFSLTAFNLLFVQVLIMSFKSWFTGKLGSWILKFNKIEILTAYFFIFLGLASLMTYYYFATKTLDPFYIFTQVCVLCNHPSEYYMTFGRISFWLAVIVILWKKFDYLNYLIFLFMGLFGYFVLPGFHFLPFLVFAIAAYLVVLYIVLFKKLPELFHDIRVWLS